MNIEITIPNIIALIIAIELTGCYAYHLLRLDQLAKQIAREMKIIKAAFR